MTHPVSGFKPTHRHYKGGVYEVISADVTLEATMEQAVLYRSPSGKLWVRPFKDFNYVVSGYTRRFEPID